MQAFRQVYLFPDLKAMLRQWGSTLDAAIGGSSLPEDAWLAASDAATAAFDIVPGDPSTLRFRVPSAGFMLVWVTSPGSPSHELREEKGAPATLSAPDVRAVAQNVPPSFAAGGCGARGLLTSRDASRSANSIAELVHLSTQGRDGANAAAKAAQTWVGALKRPRPRMSA
jgi:hypothetical protein